MCEVVVVINEGSGFSALFRVTAAGEYITQAGVASVEYAVINDLTKAVVTSLTELVVADVVFDALQLDNTWSADNLGYNLRHDAAHTLLTDPDIRYRMEYKITLTGGTEYFLTPVIIKLSEMYSN